MKNYIKQILVQLASEDKLPMDINELDSNVFDNIPTKLLLKEIERRNYKIGMMFSMDDVNRVLREFNGYNETNFKLTEEQKNEIFNKIDISASWETINNEIYSNISEILMK